jgi:hypothetical protein
MSTTGNSSSMSAARINDLGLRYRARASGMRGLVLATTEFGMDID